MQATRLTRGELFWIFLKAGLAVFCQAEDGIRASSVTGVQTCALPIWKRGAAGTAAIGVFHGLDVEPFLVAEIIIDGRDIGAGALADGTDRGGSEPFLGEDLFGKIGRASCRERV